jgi:hypothetical protein
MLLVILFQVTAADLNCPRYGCNDKNFFYPMKESECGYIAYNKTIEAYDYHLQVCNNKATPFCSPTEDWKIYECTSEDKQIDYSYPGEACNSNSNCAGDSIC